MSHLPHGEVHWYLNSPVTLTVVVEGAVSADLSSLEYRLGGLLALLNGTAVSVTENANSAIVTLQGDASLVRLTSEDNADGNAVVSVPVIAGDTSGFAVNSYPWQLHAAVSGSGPRVLAEGTIRLDPLAAAP